MQTFVLISFLLLTAFFNSASAVKRFIFRQDDIEDWYHNTVQASMINWFIDNGVGVSVGMISNNFNGADPIMYDALKRCVSVGMDKCAIWNHGMDAAFRYGEATTLAEVQARVEGCDTKIKTFFPGYKPFLMAPHQNSWGPFLIQALQNLDYKIVSASTGAYSGMAWDLTVNPMQMPQQATTGDFSSTVNDFVGVPVSKTVADCEAAAARGEVCVIMTHPHEFANGAYSLTTLAQLVQSLKAAGFTSTNFYTVMNEQLALNSVPTVLPTVVPTQAPVPTRAPTTAAPTNSNAPTVKIISTNGQCGVGFGNTFCGDATAPCCSQYGWCGALTDHCGTGCQSAYGLCAGQTYSPSTQPVAATVAPSTAIPTKQPVASASPTNQPVVPTNQPIASTASPTNQPVVPTTQPIVSTTAPTNQPIASTAAPTKQLVAATLLPTMQPVATSVPTKSPIAVKISTDGQCGVDFGNTVCGDATAPCCSQYGWCGALTDHCGTGCQSAYGLCAGQTYSPSTQPVTATVAPSIAAPTNQPVASTPTSTVSPTQAPVAVQATQLQYTAIIRVKSSTTFQYQWLNVLETIKIIEKDQNLIDLQYSGNTQVLSSAEFDVSIKMTFGLNSNSNAQSVYDTTANLLTRAITKRTFNTYYHNLGTDKKTTFTRVTYQTDTTSLQINDNNSADNSNSKHGLFSFSMSGANISMLTGVCVFIVLCLTVIGYFVYRRCYVGSSGERKRVDTITSYGSNEEMLSPSERFVELELKNHYAVPQSDNNQFVEDACLHRHGLKLPQELENV
jgi:hypothetical protein